MYCGGSDLPNGAFCLIFLSTKWVDYVEEPTKYQALRPHFFHVVDGWRVLEVGGVGGEVGGGGFFGGGVVGSGWSFFDNLVKTIDSSWSS